MMPMPVSQHRRLIQQALRFLDIDRFVLSVHGRSFPSLPHEDFGRGTPYSKGARAFLEFARDLGFNTVQLGPQGLTSRSDPSPYSSSVFARDPLLLAASTLSEVPGAADFVRNDDARRVIEGARAGIGTNRVDLDAAWRYGDMFLETAQSRLAALPAPPTGFETFRRSRLHARIDWLKRDTVYEILASLTGTDDWRQWGPPAAGALDAHLFSHGRAHDRAVAERITSLLKSNARIAGRFQLGQYLVHLQHRHFKDHVASMGMDVFGDVQIGYSHRDRWAWGPLFLKGYVLGAPPSRSNIEGQPWGYPVLDPRLMHPAGESREHGIARAFTEERFDTLLDEYHGLRIDHPHGLVCPWVYREDDPDSFHAVQNGARLNCAPNLPDHPELAQFALIGPEQIDTSGRTTRYDDEYVRDLRPEQVERFGAVIETILAHAAERGLPRSAILCEVLSTWPNPLKAVMMQHGLGRFCVTQKADPHDPHDPYRSENTSPNDWIMVGTHDTKPIWRVVGTQSRQWREDRAGLLAMHLSDRADERDRLRRLYASDQAAFCRAMFAELFLAPARNVLVFWADLLGTHETYNQPGTVGEHNWTLRVPRDYRQSYAARCARGEAFDVGACLATALRVRSRGIDEGDMLSLADRLDPAQR